jgi:hypothetical protein
VWLGDFKVFPTLTFKVFNKVAVIVLKKKDIMYRAAFKVLRYLNGAQNFGLCFSQSEMMNSIVYCDLNYTQDRYTQKSITGMAIYLGPSLIYWSTKRQTRVSTSTVEAEYCALYDTGREMVHIFNILNGLGFKTDERKNINSNL